MIYILHQQQRERTTQFPRKENMSGDAFCELVKTHQLKLQTNFQDQITLMIAIAFQVTLTTKQKLLLVLIGSRLSSKMPQDAYVFFCRNFY